MTNEPNEKENQTQGKTLKTILEEWEFMGLNEDEQLAYLNEHLLPALFSLFSAQNDVEEIVVYEGIADVVNKCLENAHIPENLKAPNLPDEADSYFNGYCNSRLITRASIENLEVPNPEVGTPDGLFIRIRTKTDREYESIVRWGAECGYLGWLENQPTRLMPTMAELRLIYFMAKYLEVAALANQNRIKAPTKSDMQLFKP